MAKVTGRRGDIALACVVIAAGPGDVVIIAFGSSIVEIERDEILRSDGGCGASGCAGGRAHHPGLTNELDDILLLPPRLIDGRQGRIRVRVGPFWLRVSNGIIRWIMIPPSFLSRRLLGIILGCCRREGVGWITGVLGPIEVDRARGRFDVHRLFVAVRHVVGSTKSGSHWAAFGHSHHLLWCRHPSGME